MRVVRDLSELREPLTKSAVTIGNFDGIHLAHQALLQSVVRSARQAGGTSVVITFDPHPTRLLAPERAPKTLTPLPVKIGLIEKESIDLLVVLQFNEQLSRLSPAEFVRNILVKKLRAVVVHVGSNFRFGYQRAGDIATLADFGKREGFRVQTLSMITIRGHRISSSEVRRLLSEGHVEIAGRMLGRPYAVSGAITTGEGVGHKKAVPTLNLSPVEQQLPRNGVYITRTRIENKLFDSVTNVGNKPTFGYHRLGVESFLLDFHDELKAGEMEVEFLHRLRDEIKFPDAEALKGQIQQDVQRSVKFFRLMNTIRRKGLASHHPTSSRESSITR